MIKELTPEELERALSWNRIALSKDTCYECGAASTKYWLFKDGQACRNSCTACNRNMWGSIKRELTVKEVFTLKLLRNSS